MKYPSIQTALKKERLNGIHADKLSSLRQQLKASQQIQFWRCLQDFVQTMRFQRKMMLEVNGCRWVGAACWFLTGFSFLPAGSSGEYWQQSYRFLLSQKERTAAEVSAEKSRSKDSNTQTHTHTHLFSLIFLKENCQGTRDKWRIRKELSAWSDSHNNWLRTTKTCGFEESASLQNGSFPPDWSLCWWLIWTSYWLHPTKKKYILHSWFSALYTWSRMYTRGSYACYLGFFI